MSLARDLHMTRWQLLNAMDSYELTMWEVFLNELARPPEEKKQPSEAIANELKKVFGVHKSAKRKK